MSSVYFQSSNIQINNINLCFVMHNISPEGLKAQYHISCQSALAQFQVQEENRRTPRNTCRSKIQTGNQVHVQHRYWGSNLGSVVYSRGRFARPPASLRTATPPACPRRFEVESKYLLHYNEWEERKEVLLLFMLCDM